MSERRKLSALPPEWRRTLLVGLAFVAVTVALLVVAFQGLRRQQAAEAARVAASGSGPEVARVAASGDASEAARGAASGSGPEAARGAASANDPEATAVALPAMERLLVAGRWPEAITLAEDALTTHPNDLTLRVGLVLARFSAREGMTRAWADLQAVRQRDAELTPVLRARLRAAEAEMALAEHHPEDAAHRGEEAERLAPKDPLVQRTLRRIAEATSAAAQ